MQKSNKKSFEVNYLADFLEIVILLSWNKQYTYLHCLWFSISTVARFWDIRLLIDSYHTWLHCTWRVKKNKNYIPLGCILTQFIILRKKFFFYHVVVRMHSFQQNVCCLIKQISCTVFFQNTRDRIKCSRFNDLNYLFGYIISYLHLI